MINVSNEFKEFMEQSSDFSPNADIAFLDGRTLSLSTPDLSVTGNTVSDSAGSSGIPLGAAICRSIRLQILNPDECFKDYDFYGAEIHLYTTAQLSDTVERIENGRFTVTSPENYSTTITVTAYDVMYRADKPYTTNLPFPATAGAVLRDVCTTYKIPLATSSFKNSDFVIESSPIEGYTARQIIGYIAMIACGNAKISRRGYLEILSYDLDFSKGYHALKNWKDIRVGSDDIQITEIRTTAVGEDGESISISAGRTVVQTDQGEDVYTDDGKLVLATVASQDDAYVLSIENPLIIGHEQDVVSAICDTLAGVPFRKFSGDHICYPLADFMDLVEVYDWRGNAYRSFITDLDFTFFGFTLISNSAEDGVKSGSSYPSPAIEVIAESRKLVAKEKSDRELAQKKLEEQLSNNRGMYKTEIPQGEGNVCYIHDKPTLKESQLVMKLTMDAIGLSTNGGVTYPYGLMITGDMIAKILQAEGISADWIVAGSLTVRDSDDNIIFNVDMTTGKMTAKDAVITGTIDANSFHFKKYTGENSYVSIFTAQNIMHMSAFDGENCYAQIQLNSERNGEPNFSVSISGGGKDVWIDGSQIFVSPSDVFYLDGNIEIGGYVQNDLNVDGEITFGKIALGVLDNTGGATLTNVTTEDLTVSGNLSFKDYTGTSGLRPIGSTDYNNRKIGRIAGRTNSSGAHYMAVNGQWDTSGYAIYNFNATSSDVRLKTNIENTRICALDTLMRIQLREFEWKGQCSFQDIGFIADELEKIDKRFVFGGGYDENGNMDVKSVDTFYLMGYLVKAIQELNDKINILEDKEDPNAGHNLNH